MTTPLDTNDLRDGDYVSVDNSYEGGQLKSYRGFVRSVKRSGTVLIDDATETDGRGTPLRHYCSSGTITRLSAADASDECDECGTRAELYHNEATGLALCEKCDAATNDYPDYDATLALARKKGTSAGRAAGLWYFDGNTDDATYAAVLKGLEDGDPETYDTLPDNPLSGEWADGLLPRDLLAELDTDEDDPAADEYLWAFEEAYRDGAREQIEKTARAFCEVATVTVYVARARDFFTGELIMQWRDEKDRLSPDTFAPITEVEIRPADARAEFDNLVEFARGMAATQDDRWDIVIVEVGNELHEWQRSDDPAPSDASTVHEAFQRLHYARLCFYRSDLALLLVWNGAHTVNVFDPWWRNVDVFSIGDFAEDAASVVDVEQACRDYNEPA